MNGEQASKRCLLENSVVEIVYRKSQVAVLEFFETAGYFLVVGENASSVGKQAFAPVPVEGAVDVSVLLLQVRSENVGADLDVVL